MSEITIENMAVGAAYEQFDKLIEELSNCFTLGVSTDYIKTVFNEVLMQHPEIGSDVVDALIDAAYENWL